MGPKILDFKPNRQFINPEFDGYKLSLQEISTSKREFDVKVHRAIPNSLQYGYLHAKLFSTHNHLIGNSDNDSVYFVDNDFKIKKVVYDPSADNEIEFTEVFQIPRDRPSESGDYNVSFKFISEKLAVVSDGMGLVYVVEIPEDIEKWNIVFSEEVLIADKKFIVRDIKMIENNLYCLLYSISTGDNKDRFFNVLNLITLTKKGDTWGQTGIKELRGGGNLYYAAIESCCKGIYIASEKTFKFTLDSDNPIIESKDSSKKCYLWSQTTEHLKIQFKINDKFESSEIIINSTKNAIDCSFKGKPFLQGTLFDNIDPNLTNWVLSGDLIEITLVKAIKDQIWHELIPGDKSGEYLSDPALAEEIHNKLSHLCSDKEENVPVGNTFSSEQVEECDFEGDTYCVFERFCLTSHIVTHRYNMDSHKMILCVKGNDDVTAIGLRHDVDTYLWQPIFENDEFSLKHFGTLNAFGYVEASKQQKKFTECAPDLSYSVICESNRHVFIYKQKKSIESGELRNRVTGRQVGFIAQQQVINISDEIIGVFASNSKLFLLTDNSIFIFRM